MAIRRVRDAVAVGGLLCLAGCAALLYGRIGGSDPGDAEPEDPLARAILAAYQAGQRPEALEITYPLDETLFPPGIAAPTFRWKDTHAEADTWLVTVALEGGSRRLSSLTREPHWTPSRAQWEAIQRRSLGSKATVAVVGVKRDAPSQILSAASIAIRTSRDEVGAPLFYREVNLPFVDAVKDPSHIRWRFGSVGSRERPRVVLSGLPVCGNCHSFSGDGAILGMDVDYANDKGSYAVVPVAEETALEKSGIITWSDYRREDGEQTYGLLSQVSPDGRHIVSTVKDRSVFVAKPGLEFSQLFFPVKGILAVYCRETRKFHALPGADDKRFVQSNPAWSPDGKDIVFARAKAFELKSAGDGKILLSAEECREFLDGGRDFVFDLYRIPFNGGKGGQAEPLEGASCNGKSNYFAKYSPDGKWIVFCQARSFMLLQPDSRLCIIPASGGKARVLRANTPRMNSWHSWSPNSRWLVFASKANGPYTQLFLTHIDSEGRSTPPVLLEHFTEPDRAANIPEFVNVQPQAIRAIRERFVDDHSFERAGDEFLKGGEPDRAAAAYRKALALNPANATAHNNLGVILLKRKKLDEAMAHFLKALQAKPSDPHCRRNIGDTLIHQGKTDEAMARYREALRLDPKYTEVRVNLGLLLLMARRHDEATAEFAEAVRHDPDNAQTHYHLGRALKRQGKSAAAVPKYRRALELSPDHLSALFDLAVIRAADPDPKVRDGEEAIQLATKACKLTRDRDPKMLDVLAAAYAQAGQFLKAKRIATKAFELARRAGDERLARRIRARIGLYAQRKAIPASRR